MKVERDDECHELQSVRQFGLELTIDVESQAK